MSRQLSCGRSARNRSITLNRKKKRSSRGCPGVQLPSLPSCATCELGLLPWGYGDGWRYAPAVRGTGNDDSSHRIAQGRCSRKVLALAGHDSMEFLAASHRGIFGAHPVWSAHGVVEGQRAQRGHELQLPSQGRAEGRSASLVTTFRFSYLL
jgi:hypothetical protein